MREINMPPAIESMFDEIVAAIGVKFYYLAMAVTLTIPDICAGAELDLAKHNVKREHYEDWCSRYLIPQYKLLDSSDIYMLRGGMVHTGQFSHRHQKYTRPFFTVPGALYRAHDSIMTGMGAQGESTLQIDLEEFVRTMGRAVETWYSEKKDDDLVRANVERIIRVRPQGIAPFVTGTMVVG